MLRIFSLIGALALLLTTFTGCNATKEAKAGTPAKAIDRGKYLVENVGMCADCHTARQADGQFDRSRWLQGSMVVFKPIDPMPVWAVVAPAIAGLPGHDERDAIVLLETGLTPTGGYLRPPMPEYRFSHEDAQAVVTYLKSLAPTQ